MTEDFHSGAKAVAIVGLGYVGLPLCIGFGTVYRNVRGFDINESRVAELKSGYDKTGSVTADRISKASVCFTSDPDTLKDVHVIIISVPTPVTEHKIPDLGALESASETVGRHMTKGVTVVYESTVYPGVTEEICCPILERSSGLKAGVDFKLGYSPERINPGDEMHSLESIVKIVAGQDEETTSLLAELYGKVAKAGICRARDIKTAEAAKVIENIQRDLNIALMNELALIFHKLDIDIRDVLAAARTKWNFLPFEPGLVGGHCIGVDPYYLTFKAEEVDYHPEVILVGRRINDHMGKFIAEQTIKELIKVGLCFTGNKILVLGCTFKEDVKDVRNSRVVDIVNELKEYGVTPIIFDPEADREEMMSAYGIALADRPEDHAPFDGIIIAVRHRVITGFSLAYLRTLCGNVAVMIDVKGIHDRIAATDAGFKYWRL